MGIRNLFTNWLVWRSRGFWPSKKIKDGNGHTISSATLFALSHFLIKYAGVAGPIDIKRLKLLERVFGHFTEHVLYTEYATSFSVKRLAVIKNNYETEGHHTFSREFEKEFNSLNLKNNLPPHVRKEILSHLAMFMKVDSYVMSHLDKYSNIRDEHGFLFGSVTDDDVNEILNVSAGYMIEGKVSDDLSEQEIENSTIYPEITLEEFRGATLATYDDGWEEAELQGECEDGCNIHALFYVLASRLQSSICPPQMTDEVVRDLRIETLPFMSLSRELAKNSICEYLVWKEFPEMANLDVVKSAIEQVEKEGSLQELIEEGLCLSNDIAWMKLLSIK